MNYQSKSKEELICELQDLQKKYNILLNENESEITAHIQTVAKLEFESLELATSKAKLEAALESMSDAVFISDNDGNFIEFNEAFAIFHKFKNKEECAKILKDYPDFLDVYLSSGEFLPLDQWAVPRALRGEIVKDAEYTLRHKTTGETWIGSYNFAPIYDKDGTITGSVVVGRDITNQKANIEQIKELNRNLEILVQDRIHQLSETENKNFIQSFLLDQIHNAVITVDFENRILTWNKYAETLYQYTREEAVGKNIIELLAADEIKPIVHQNFERLYADGHWEGDFNVLRKDKTTISVHIVNSYLKDFQGTNIGFIGVSADITEQIRQEIELITAKNKLEEIEKLKTITLEKLNEAQVLSKIGSWEWNIITGKVWWSDELYKIFEVNPDNYIPSVESNAMFVHPDDSEAYHKAAFKCLETGEELDFTLRLITSTGKLKNCRSKAKTLFDSEQKALRMAGFFIDITLQVQLDYELQKANEQYRIVTENTSDGIYVLNIDTFKFNYISPSVFGLTGYSQEERMETGFGPIIAPELREKVNQDIRSAFNEFKKNQDTNIKYRAETQLIHKNGNRFWAETIITFHVGKDNENLAIGVTRNIDDRKKIENALKKSEEKFKYYFEHSLHGKSITQFSGEMNVNQAVCDMLGYTRDELQNYDWREFTHPDDIEITNNGINMLISGEQDWFQMEKRFIHKNGSIIWTEIGTSILRDSDGKMLYLMTSLINITERKVAEAELKTQNEKLHKLNSERDKFFSIISHDLRGPMGGLMGLVEMMAEEDQPFTEDEKKEMIMNLSLSARNTFNLLENLLEWSLMDRGLIEFKPQKLDLFAMMNECRNIAAESARKKMIEVLMDIPDESQVFADKNMLQTVIRNLLSNALKFTPKGGQVTISVSQTVNEMTVISVKDTGIGMSDDMRNNIFRIDAITKRPGTEGEQSTGLGLQLCREFVEKQGGKIWVGSVQFKGTVFSFTIPSIGQKVNEIEISKTELKKRPAGKINNLQILIAEDDDISAKLISLMVKGFSRYVFNVQNGDEAVKVCRDNPDIDLILMDIAMPGLDGFEATRQIRQFNKGVVIIAQTTFALSADKQRAIAAGFNDYIAKPVGKEALIELIKKHIK